MVRTYWFGPGV